MPAEKRPRKGTDPYALPTEPDEWVMRTEGQETWLYAGLPDGWLAAYRLEAQGGRPVPAELRIFREGPIPPGGVPARVLRRVRIQRDLWRSRAMMADLRRRFGDALFDPKGPLGRRGFRLEEIGRVRRPGRRGYSDLDYARLAGRYVALLAGGSRSPVADLAREVGMSPPTVSQLVFTARNERGMLTESPPGRAGGDLTEKARKLLERETEKRRPKERSRKARKGR